MVGAFITGPVSSKIGKWNSLVSLNIMVIFSQIIQSIPACFGNVAFLAIAKFIFGISCGGFNVICPKFVNETAPK